MEYNDFRSYIQINYENELYEFLREFLDSHNGESSAKYEMSNLKIVSVRSKLLKLPYRMIDIDMKIMVDISIYAKKTWFDVLASINSEKRLIIKSINIGAPEKSTAGQFVFNEFILSDLSDEEMENVADQFWISYCKDAIFNMYRFPLATVLEKVHMYIEESILPESVMGRMYFRKTEISTYIKHPRFGNLENVESVLPGTVVLNAQGEFWDKVGGYVLTVTHEIVHWMYHRDFFEILSLLSDDTSVLECNSKLQVYADDFTGREKAMWFAEWQANALGMRIALPRIIFEKMWEKQYQVVSQMPHKNFNKAEITENVILRISKLCGISEFVVKQRAIQLGKDEAIGTLLYVNNKYYAPIGIKAGVLSWGETVIVSERDLKDLCKKNEYLQELLNTRKFVYLGYVVCINDAKYLEKKREGEYELTEYARNNINECCLIFYLKSIYEINDKRKFYDQVYFNQEVSSYDYEEHNHKVDIFNPNDKRNKDAEEICRILEKVKEAKRETVKINGEVSNAIVEDKDSKTEFGKILKYHMNRKHITVKILADRTYMSTTIIEDWRDGKKKPRLDNVMAIIIGLNLKPDYCWRLLNAAGFSLEGTDDKTIIYKYLIEKHTDGDINQWNHILKAVGLPEIPNKQGEKKKNDKAEPS